MARIEAARPGWAAVDIVRAADAHSSDGLTTGLELRVGINAGESEVADGDLFGLSVTLAARLCNIAEPSTILAGESVWVLCLGKSHSFADRGVRRLKGFEEEVRISEVLWRDP
jgi:adenylate cyclase